MKITKFNLSKRRRMKYIRFIKDSTCHWYELINGKYQIIKKIRYTEGYKIE